MFFEFKHGGHALAKDDGHKDVAARGRRDVVTPEQAGNTFDPDSMTPFRYLADGMAQDDLLPVSPETVVALDNLGNAMVAQTPPRGRDDTNPDSTIPPIFTYWSQFIDHELTARTDRDGSVSDITVDDASLTPADRADVEYKLLNRRTPALELDCLYGDGPPGAYGRKVRRSRDRNLRLARKLRDGAKMRIGSAEVVNQGPARPGQPPNTNEGQPSGPVPPPANDLSRDLPRIGALLDLGVVEANDFPESLRTSPTFRQRAFIGDPRNDENLVVAQFHLALLRFHNAIVDWLRFKDSHQERGPGELFEDARKIVRWTFQWLTVNQFLKRLLKEDVVDQVLQNGASLYRRRLEGSKGPYGLGEPYMPVEFSAACYRFGHSMIRHQYDFNRNFGRKPGGGPASSFPVPPSTFSSCSRGKPDRRSVGRRRRCRTTGSSSGIGSTAARPMMGRMVNQRGWRARSIRSLPQHLGCWRTRGIHLPRLMPESMNC